MKLQNHIDNLRQKPEAYRRRFAFWSAFGITAIIGLFWLGSITGINIQASQAVSLSVSRAGTPAQSLMAAVGALAGDVWSLATGPSKVEYASIEVQPPKGK